MISRRHLVASAAATAAVAAMPAAAIGAVAEVAEPIRYMDPALLAWTPGQLLRPRQLIEIAGRLHVVLFDHVAVDEPSSRYISRPLITDDDGFFVEEDE